MAFDLATYTELLEQSEEQVRRTLHIGDDGGRQGRYEGLESVTDLYNPDVFPAHVYVRDGRVEMIYIPSGDALKGLTRDELEAELGDDGTRLRSRVGKHANHYAFPRKGVAFSSDDQAVKFVEVFPPRSLEAYQTEIYREPPPFKR